MPSGHCSRGSTLLARNETLVIDTHALLWYMERNPRLSEGARSALNDIGQGICTGAIPTIVLAEVMFASEKRRTPLAFGDVFSQVRDSRNFVICALDERILSLMESMRGNDLHDRIIVATALALGGRLVTADRDIKESGVVDCIW